MSRNARVLEIVLQRAGRPVSLTRLLKLTYLADLHAWQVLGAPISEFTYVRHHHGPFDRKYHEALEDLCEAEHVALEEKTTRSGDDFTLVRITPACPPPTPGEFTRGQLYLIDHAVEHYGRMDLERLLADVVYRTEPMLSARHGEPLDMARQRNKERDAAGGISLETILESRERFDRGEGISLEEALREFGGSGV